MSEKKYIIDDEKLMSEWNWAENNNLGLYPQILTFGSNKKASWKCSLNHVWKAQIINRVKGQNCPYCSNHRLLKGFNDLESIAPQLTKEWNYKRNRNICPSEIFPNSNKKVWWICNLGHEWEASPNHRINHNNSCPYCSNHRVLQGFNDLAKTHPLLVKEWDFEKNGDLLPTNVSYGSSKKVWWKCIFGHEWQAIISSRSHGTGCPMCKKELATSYPEQIIYYYIKKLFSDTTNRYVENKKELDIFIPSKKIGIEYDGMFYHNASNRQKEIDKDKYFSSRRILVLRIKEKKGENQSFIKNNTIFYTPRNAYKNIDEVLTLLVDKIANYTNTKIDQLHIDLEKDNDSILELFISTLKENSIIKNPLLAQEWNYEKNGSLKPEFFPISSGKKVWWKCKHGHEWKAEISSRNQGRGCPYCANQKILPGFNDLQSQLPELAQEWHPTKNHNLLPNNVPLGSNKKVWWLCKKGHEWQANIQPRTKGVGCPYCTNQKVLPGYNDLKSQNSALAKEWHPVKNGSLLPDMFSCGSGKKVWWKCKDGHEWQAIINHRNRGAGCPICYKNNPKITSNKKINVYYAKTLEYVQSFSDAKSLCVFFGIQYNKQAGNISMVCKRKQKTLLNKYILRYDYDDELK